MKFPNLLIAGALAITLLLPASCSTPQETSSLLLGGDVMLYRGGEPIFSSGSPWGEVVDQLSIDQVDLFAVNLESPFGDVEYVSRSENPRMNLCAGEDTVGILAQGGIDLVTTANNHSTDCSIYSLSTSDVVESAGIQLLDEEKTMLLVPAGDQTVAFVAVDAYTGTFDRQSLMDAITSAAQLSDLVVVSIHWGIEYQAGPSREQENLAQELINAGADVVWGHHPHVLQRMEWRESEMDGRRALVMYSLGNLLADQWMLPDTSREALVQIEFEDHGISAIKVYPLLMNPITKRLELLEEGNEMTLITQRLNLDSILTVVETWKD